MFDPIPSPYLVPSDGSFRLAEARTAPPPDAPGEEALEERLEKSRERLAKLQPRLFAEGKHALLLVFQAMDGGGKDGTIREITRGLNPAGVRVSPFGRPSEEELKHDWLWRVARQLPGRGMIGIFNRSHYEEVLVVRVHPGILDGQRLPGPDAHPAVWSERLESIRAFELHLARSGTHILKFWLNISHEEQRKRFLDRLDEEDSRWKFNAGDLAERGHWDAYMAAYDEALRETSRPWAPWYAIPADDKDFGRATVAEIVARALEELDPQWPPFDEETTAQLPSIRAQLEGEGARDAPR